MLVVVVAIVVIVVIAVIVVLVVTVAIAVTAVIAVILVIAIIAVKRHCHSVHQLALMCFIAVIKYVYLRVNCENPTEIFQLCTSSNGFLSKNWSSLQIYYALRASFANQYRQQISYQFRE